MVELSKIKNNGSERKTIFVVTRERVDLDPGDEIEFDGEIELG